MKFFELKMRLIAPLGVLCCFVFFGSQSAQAQYNKLDPGNNNPPPAGAILDLNGTPIPTSAYQQYSVSFTATVPNTAITFAIREDPAFLLLSNVSVTDVTTPSGNLLVNGDFSGGTYIVPPSGSNPGNPAVPNSWTYANQYGAFAGGVVVRSCGIGGGSCWDDGAVQAYDAISQTIATTVGHIYQITFSVRDTGGSGIFSDVSTNGDTTNTGGNGRNLTVYAQAGLPVAASPVAYTNDNNIADFTSGITAYATFSNFSNSDGCATLPFTPTSAELAGPNACRVYGGTLTGTGLSGSNWIEATFSNPVSTIVVFPNIDHLGSAYDGYQYKIAGSNDGTTWTLLFDALTVNGAGEPFTLGTFSGTAPSTVNNVLTPGAGPGGISVGYIAQFQFGTAYTHYAFGASTEASNAGNPDQELSAVGASSTPVQAQNTPAAPSPSSDTTVMTVFNNNAGEHVENDVILPPNNVSTLTFPSGVDPATLTFQSINRIVSNANLYTTGTPFATFVPFDHAGNDAVAGSTGNGAKYEVLCSDATHPPSEANCPFPNPAAVPPAHIRGKDIFAFPTDGSGNPIQPTICTPGVACGTTVSFAHWAPFGNTGATGTPGETSWSPSNTSPNSACPSPIVPASANTPPCNLEDILTNMSGDNGGGTGSDTKKGDYFLGYNVPMLLSAVKVNGKSVNTPGIQGTSPFFVSSSLNNGLTFDFNVAPAQLPSGFTTQSFTSIARTGGNLVTVTMSAVPAAWVNGTLLINPVDTTDFPLISTAISNVTSTTFQYTQTGPNTSSSAGGTASNANGWIAAPVFNLFYHFDPLISAQDYPNTLTDLNDLTNCPGANCVVPTTSPSQPGASSTKNVEFTTTPVAVPTEGKYLLQWSAADTLKTRERFIQLLTSGSCPNPPNLFPTPPTPPCYSTKLFNAQIIVDNTPPTITTSTSGSFPAILNGPSPTLNFICADPPLTSGDPGSGIQVCGISPSVNIPSPGSATFTGSDGPLSTATPGSTTIPVYAQDVAGNNATPASVNYSVQYEPKGTMCDGDAGHQILQPVNVDGTSVWKQGRTIPVKFRVCDAKGVSIGTVGVITSFVLTQIISGTVANVDETIDATIADSGFRFDTTAQQWIFNLSTTNQAAGATYVWQINLNDGTAITFQYGLR